MTLETELPGRTRIARTALVILFSLGTTSLVVACGSDSSDNVDGGNGSGQDGGPSGPVVPDESPGSGTLSGGHVELSEDEVAAIADASCTGWSGEGEMLPAVLQLVVDVSRSMIDPPPNDPDPRSKWEITRDALRDALDSLEPNVSVGLVLYPNLYRAVRGGGGEGCFNDDFVPIEQLGNEGSDQRERLDDALRTANINGYTPTHDAYRYALEESLLPYETSARKFMLLITDGAPTVEGGCRSVPDQTDAPTEPIIEEIANASDLRVSTFLIGSPGSDESRWTEEDMRPWLSEAAIEGGTAIAGCSVEGPDFCHLDMTDEPDFADALAAGLGAIASQLSDSCSYSVPEPPSGESIDPNATNLVVSWASGDATLVLQDSDEDCTEGWYRGDSGEVVLCSDTCEQLQNDEQARVLLTFGCTSDQIIDLR